MEVSLLEKVGLSKMHFQAKLQSLIYFRWKPIEATADINNKHLLRLQEQSEMVGT